MGISEGVIQGLIEGQAVNKARLDNLETWQTSQNGAIHRVEDDVKSISEKISKAGWALAGTLLGVAVELIIMVIFLTRGLKP